ncbi:MAG TPA: tetratricopeptide repeat protein [Byssovorax sp.]|jgi:hypothetical protein
MASSPRHVAAIAIALGLHVAIAPLAYAQPRATSTSLIQRGSALFEDQQYEESIQTLSAALVRPGTSFKEKTEIYRLLAYNYIILKRTDEADAAVRGLLVLDERFTLPPTESPRFRDFFDNTKKKWEAEGKPGRETAAAAGKTIAITHTPPVEIAPDTAIRLSGSVEDPDSRVKAVQLAYRTGAKGKFITVPATYTLGAFTTQIPPAAVKPPLVEYYVQALDQGGLPIGSRGDAATPIRVVVTGSSSVLASPWFWVPVGLAAAGGVVLTVVLLTKSSSSGRTSQVTVGVRE